MNDEIVSRYHEIISRHYARLTMKHFMKKNSDIMKPLPPAPYSVARVLSADAFPLETPKPPVPLLWGVKYANKLFRTGLGLDSP